MATEITPHKEERWLSCRLDKGMFSDEVAVTYPSTGTWKKSVFVPQTAVQGSVGARGKVRVVIVRREGRVLAVLPNAQSDVVEIVEADTSTD